MPHIVETGVNLSNLTGKQLLFKFKMAAMAGLAPPVAVIAAKFS